MWVPSFTMLLYSALIYVNSALSQFVYDRPDFYGSYFPIDKAVEYNMRHDLVPQTINRRSQYSKSSRDQIVNSHFKVKKSHRGSYVQAPVFTDKKLSYDVPSLPKYKVTPEPKHYNAEDFIVEPSKIYSDSIGGKLDVESTIPPKTMVAFQQGLQHLEGVPTNRDKFDFRFINNRVKKMDGPVQMNVRKSQVTGSPRRPHMIKDRQPLPTVMSPLINFNPNKVSSKSSQSLGYGVIRHSRKTLPRLMAELVEGFQLPNVRNKKRNVYLANREGGEHQNYNNYDEHLDNESGIKPCCSEHNSDVQKNKSNTARIGAEVENNDLPYALFYRSKSNGIHNDDNLKKAYVERFKDGSRLQLNSSQAEIPHSM